MKKRKILKPQSPAAVKRPAPVSASAVPLTIQTPGPSRYPIWSAKAVLLIALPVVVTIALLVFVLSDRSVFVETQITLLLISLCLFAFLTVGLYRGVRLQQPDKDDIAYAIQQFDSRNQGSNRGWLDLFVSLFLYFPPDLSHWQAPHINLPDLPDTGDDWVGALVAILMWVLVLAALVALMWVLAQFIAILPVLAMGLCWVFYRALRIVFAKSRVCKGQWRRSAGYGLVYTVVYVGWIFALLWISGFVYAGLHRMAG